MKTLIAIFAFALTLQTRAEIKIQDGGDNIPKDPFVTKAANFKMEDPKSLDGNSIKYAYRLQEFATWGGAEKKLLNLFDGFHGKPDHPLMVYVAKATFILNKPSDQVNLRPFVTLDGGIKTVDMKMDLLVPNKVITYTETTSSYRNPPAPAKWCANDNDTLCTFTRFVLPGDFQAGLRDEAKKVKSKYEYLEAQGESKIYSGEIPNSNDYAALTGLATKPTGLAVQNAFWFTHILGFGKNVFVFQPNPANPAQTIVTGYLVYAIEHKHWDREKDVGGIVIKLSDFFLGKSALNDDKGIPQGLPKYTQLLLKNLANVLSH